jgi:hypothetical protein
MITQHAGNFLHRFQAAAQGAVAPGIQKAGRPEGRLVRPEMQEGFFQLPGSGRLQFAGDQRVELLASLTAHPASLAQQRPAHVLELLGFVFALGFQSGSLCAAHLVHGMVHVLGDVEAIQHMQRLSRFGGKNVQIGVTTPNVKNRTVRVIAPCTASRQKSRVEIRA